MASLPTLTAACGHGGRDTDRCMCRLAGFSWEAKVEPLHMRTVMQKQINIERIYTTNTSLGLCMGCDWIGFPHKKTTTTKTNFEATGYMHAYE